MVPGYKKTCTVCGLRSFPHKWSIWNVKFGSGSVVVMRCAYVIMTTKPKKITPNYYINLLAVFKLEQQPQRRQQFVLWCLFICFFFLFLGLWKITWQMLQVRSTATSHDDNINYYSKFIINAYNVGFIVLPNDLPLIAWPTNLICGSYIFGLHVSKFPENVSSAQITKVAKYDTEGWEMFPIGNVHRNS